MKRSEHLKVLRDLTNKTPIPEKIKEQHGDIEASIVERGGHPGSIRHA